MVMRNKSILEKPVGGTSGDIADAIAKKHVRQHSITQTLDHTSTATSGKMLKADANGLPVDATNTDTDVASAVSLKHAAVTVSAPIVLTGQAIELKNNAGSPATLNDIAVGAMATPSALVVPNSKAVADYAGVAVSSMIMKNRQETNANYSLESGYNGTVLGPWTVGNGYAFTIPDGSRFMVLNG